MDKKVLVENKKYDDKEDLEITKTAEAKVNNQGIFVVLLVTFIVMLVAAVLAINNYYKNKDTNNILEVNNSKNKITIVNNETVSKTIDNDTFSKEKEIVLENIDTIELITNKDSEENSIIHYNVKYNITKNDFWRNLYANSDSEVLVRFSYSYDGKEWNFINNVLSTTLSTLNPLVGNYYDVAGMETNIKVATNYELEVEPGSAKKIYWRSETVFQKDKSLSEAKNYVSTFKIEYQDN